MPTSEPTAAITKTLRLTSTSIIRHVCQAKAMVPARRATREPTRMTVPRREPFSAGRSPGVSTIALTRLATAPAGAIVRPAEGGQLILPGDVRLVRTGGSPTPAVITAAGRRRGETGTGPVPA